MDERTVAMKGVSEERLMPAIVDLVTANGGWVGIEALVVGGIDGEVTGIGPDGKTVFSRRSGRGPSEVGCQGRVRWRIRWATSSGGVSGSQ